SSFFTPRHSLAINDAGLAEVTIEQEIHARYVRVNVTMTYAGQQENTTSSFDTIRIIDQIQDLSLQDSNGELLIHTTELRFNDTYVNYQFPRELSPGERYSVIIKYRQETISDSSTEFRYTSGIDWLGTAGVQRETVLLYPGLSLKSSSYQPHSISTVEGGWLKLTWYETAKGGFFTQLRYSRPLLNSLEIIPDQWELGTISSNSIPLDLELMFFNDGDDSVSLVIETDEWFDVNMTNFVLEPGDREYVRCWITTTKQGVYTSSLKILTNLSSNYIYTVSINVTIKNQADYGSLYLLAATALLVMIGGASFLYINRKKQIISIQSIYSRINENNRNIERNSGEVEPLIMTNSANTEYLANTDVIDPDPGIITRLNEMRDFLSEKENAVLEVLVKNDGISQQDIVRETGISKATVSRIVNRLLSKKLVEKRQSGMSNLIYLGKKLTR
ncbi:MAG: helix-turn-helix transcriptional regulator, partial [Candidatus Hodarchaeales archaeon]